MLQGTRCVVVWCTVVALLASWAAGQASEPNLEQDWNDFLHYAAIGRFDLAQGFGQRIVDGSPDPVALLKLSEANPNGYALLLRMQADSEQLREVSTKILEIIEQGRFQLSTDPRIINQEIRRLSSTIRARMAAEQRLKNAGEYAIPFMLDALADGTRENEVPNITAALPKIGRHAIRPLAAALQTRDVAVRGEIVRALGRIGYPQALAYLKYCAEKDASPEVQRLAVEAIEKIDPAGLQIPAAEHFFLLGEKYYDHAPSVAPPGGYGFANVWFWDAATHRLVRKEVELDYFHELMAMRCCEWALRADPEIGKAIALWIAAFFKAESYGVEMPAYFGDTHADAMTYATTAGPEYLHAALARALDEGNGFVALGVVEALATNAGEASLLYRFGTEQPLVRALDFKDRAVRYSAAIAIGQAKPNAKFIGSPRIIENLAEAITDAGLEDLGRAKTDEYASRAIDVMLQLAISQNVVVDLSQAKGQLIAATADPRESMQVRAGRVLAYLPSPDAQRAIAAAALNAQNSMQVRIEAFTSLAVSAKRNGCQLAEGQIDAIYGLVDSGDTNPALRKAAAGAYGALNLPSRRVKDLILGQAKS